MQLGHLHHHNHEYIKLNKKDLRDLRTNAMNSVHDIVEFSIEKDGVEVDDTTRKFIEKCCGLNILFLVYHLNKRIDNHGIVD